MLILSNCFTGWRRSFKLILSNWLTGGIHLCLFYLIG